MTRERPTPTGRSTSSAPFGVARDHGRSGVRCERRAGRRSVGPGSDARSKTPSLVFPFTIDDVSRKTPSLVFPFTIDDVSRKTPSLVFPFAIDDVFPKTPSSLRGSHPSSATSRRDPHCSENANPGDVTGFSNREEDIAGNLKGTLPLSIEDELRARGATYSAGAPWQPNALRDGLVITGPATAVGTRHGGAGR
jgi:hypothetical protein